MRIGLTGGIGCGKSTAGKCFADLGWRRLDSDEVVRELLATDAELHAKLRERWGDEAVLPECGANRSFIAHKVFHDKGELAWWENQVIPKVRARWQGALAAEPDADWLVEVPLLFERDLAGQFDATICVEAPESTQLARLAAKGLDREQSLARINNQLPVLDKARRADLVLSNAGSFDFLLRQVRRASEMLRSQSPIS
ncbi:dephospho-CoA kinase [Cerasicoccus fimbriatus]|uniref:dephospho-CoA kinase n=1 Tax=Cerasicoccus fimbriatus TaxID=3014554 RepID=UPI0022B5250E|nr:dephospho-CoA kinase [Cerasicoccus sp. TK19100]